MLLGPRIGIWPVSVQFIIQEYIKNSNILLCLTSGQSSDRIDLEKN